MKNKSNRKNDIILNDKVFENLAKKKQKELQNVVKESDVLDKNLFISIMWIFFIVLGIIAASSGIVLGVLTVLYYTTSVLLPLGILSIIFSLFIIVYLVFMAIKEIKLTKIRYSKVDENLKHIEKLSQDYLEIDKKQIVETEIDESSIFNLDGSINFDKIENGEIKEFIISLVNENEELKNKIPAEEVNENQEETLENSEENVDETSESVAANEEKIEESTSDVASESTRGQTISITFDPDNADNIIISRSGELIKGEGATVSINGNLVPISNNGLTKVNKSNPLTSRVMDEGIATYSSGEKHRDLKVVDEDIKKNDQQNKVYRIMHNVGLLLLCLTLPLFLVMLVIDATIFNGSFPIEIFLAFYLLANVIYIVGNVASLITRNKNETLTLEKRLIEEDNSGSKIYLIKSNREIPSIVESKEYRGEIKEKKENSIFNFFYIAFFAIWDTVILAVLGSALCATIIGIPAGVSLFKFIPSVFKPRGKEVVLHFKSHPVLNTITFIFGGFITYLITMCLGLVYLCTIVGAPLAMQIFKFAPYFLAPFGSEILTEGTYSNEYSSVHDMTLLLKGVMVDDRDVTLSNGLVVRASEAMRLVLDKDERELLNGYSFNSIFGALFNKFSFTLPTKTRNKDKYKTYSIERKMKHNGIVNYLSTFIRTYFFVGLIYGLGLFSFIAILQATNNNALANTIIEKMALNFFGFNGVVFAPINALIWPYQIGLYFVVFPFLIYIVIIAVLGSISHYSYRKRVYEIYMKKWRNLVSYYPKQDSDSMRLTSMEDKISFLNKKDGYIKGRSLRDVIRDIID